MNKYIKWGIMKKLKNYLLTCQLREKIVIFLFWGVVILSIISIIANNILGYPFKVNIKWFVLIIIFVSLNINTNCAKFKKIKEWAKKEKSSNYEDNILINAIKKGKNEFLINILNRGIKNNFKDKSEINLLMYAAKYQNIEILDYLIDKGVELNTCDKNGKTTLMYFVENLTLDKLKEIINKNELKICDKDNKDRTLLMYACSNKDLNVF